MDDQTTKPRRRWTHQEDNRARLIDAGYAILAEKGFEAATVKEIARLAGVSPGLFHYYFESKDELLLAVMWEAGKRFRDRLAEDLRSSMTREEFSAKALIVAHKLAAKDPQWFRLRYELFALALRNPKFGPPVGEFLAAIRQGMSATVQRATGMDEARAQAVGAVMLACFDGLALQQLVQPEADLNSAYEVVQNLIDSQSADS